MKQLQRYLAVDIGGTAVKYSILNESYEELECGEEATQKDQSAADDLGQKRHDHETDTEGKESAVHAVEGGL